MTYGIAGYVLDDLRNTLEDTAGELSDAHKRIDALQAVLDDVLEYMDQRADADHDGDRFVPNEEMRLMLAIEAVMS